MSIQVSWLTYRVPEVPVQYPINTSAHWTLYPVPAHHTLSHILGRVTRGTGNVVRAHPITPFNRRNSTILEPGALLLLFPIHHV